jgi:hypothetical protein
MSFIVEHVRHRGPIAVKTKAAPTCRPMSREEIVAEIAAIKDQAVRLRPPLNQRPNAFHEDKSDLVAKINRLEDAIRGNRPLRDAPT